MLNQGQKISAFLIIFFLISIYAFILSDSGLLMRNQLEIEKKVILERIEILKNRNNQLAEINNDVVNGKITKKDFLNSGYISYGDRILFLKGLEAKKRKKDIKISHEDEFGIHLRHMRIFWFIFSLMTLLLYFSLVLRRNKSLDPESSSE